MRRHPWLVVAVALLLAAGAGLAIASTALEAGSSTLSRGPTGWLAARAYLQRRGTPVDFVDRPLADADGSGRDVLVLAFPWQSHLLDVDGEAVLAHLARGGDVLVAYSGEVAAGPEETAILLALDAPPQELSGVPLSPWGWRAEMRRIWRLRAAGPSSGGRADGSELRLRRPRWVPHLARAAALLRGPSPQRAVVAAAWPLRRGRVIVLPAELLSNARLGNSPGSAAMLESLRRWLGRSWRFDEYHHGLAAAGASGESLPAGTRLGFDLLLVQLLLIYALAALALTRRLGPAWREAPPFAGSAASFLLRLGALHHRLGHHRDGATLLLRRAAELDRRLAGDPRLSALAVGDDAAALVAVGQRVARLQRSLKVQG